MGCFSTTVQAPAPINPAQVGAESLATQLGLAPDVFAAESKYAPQYALLQEQILRDSLLGRQAFDSNKYQEIRPDLLNNWNADPEGYGAVYGSLENYLRADYDAHGQKQNPELLGTQGGLLDLYSQAAPRLTQLQTDANTAMRTADIADVEALGGRAREAYLAANPELAKQFGELEARLATSRNVTPGAERDPSLGVTLGPANRATAAQAQAAQAQAAQAQASTISNSAVLQELERQAMEELQSGGRLSGEALRQSQQSVRAGFSDRGMGMSNRAIFSEALDAEDLRRKRLAEARAFGGTVDASLARDNMFNAGQEQQANLFNADALTRTSQFNAGNQQQANLFNADALTRTSQFNADSANQFDLTRYGNESGNARFLTEQDRLRTNDLFAQEMSLANLYSATASDPYQLVLGRSGVPSLAQGAVGQAGYSAGAGPSLFDPFNSSILSIYSGNQANQLAAQTATANNRTSLIGAGIGAIGSLGGAAIGAGLICWVAREVYGEENPRWLQFRGWLLERAPDWLREAYIARGERFARLISNRPRIKVAVRAWMDAILARDAFRPLTSDL